MQRRYTLYNMFLGLAFMKAVCLASCTTNTVYDSYSHTPLTGWEKNDTLTFCVPKLREAGL